MVNFKSVPSYVESVQIKGLQQTDEAYVRANISSAIFEAKTFYEVLDQTEQIRRNLHKLGCFKDVAVLIDSKESKIIRYVLEIYAEYQLFYFELLQKDGKPHAYQVVINVEEKSSVGGSINTSIGNNEGSLVLYNL